MLPAPSMPHAAPSQRRWLAAFGLTLACLAGLALWLYLRLPSFRSPAFDFRTLGPDQSFVTQGLTRRQDGSLKLGFAESYPPPRIGAYGNHIINHLSSEAFGRAPDPAFFFNYAFANLALPELEAYLVHLEKLGHLPTQLALVQITTPNNDNGHYIVNWGHELPPDILLERLVVQGNLGNAAGLAWQMMRSELKEVLNYNTAILSLVQGGADNRIASEAACQDAPPEWLQRLPVALRGAVGPIAGRSFYCLPQNRWYAYRRDGSMPLQPGEGPVPLIRNENPLKDSERELNAGDEARIARYLRAIEAIGRRAGIKLVFLVPPVYETDDRRDSQVNRIFDRGLALAPEVPVIDHRHLHGDPALFHDYRHPSPRYYRLLADELRRRGYLD